MEDIVDIANWAMAGLSPALPYLLKLVETADGVAVDALSLATSIWGKVSSFLNDSERSALTKAAKEPKDNDLSAAARVALRELFGRNDGLLRDLTELRGITQSVIVDTRSDAQDVDMSAEVPGTKQELTVKNESKAQNISMRTGGAGSGGKTDPKQ